MVCQGLQYSETHFDFQVGFTKAPSAANFRRRLRRKIVTAELETLAEPPGDGRLAARRSKTLHRLSPSVAKLTQTAHDERFGLVLDFANTATNAGRPQASTGAPALTLGAVVIRR